VSRTGESQRVTGETDVRVRVNLDGTGRADISTGVGFFDHMLTLLAHHSLIDLEITARGDLDTGSHHTVEDVGITLGQALREALGDKSGISRFGDALVPLDETSTELWERTLAINLTGGFLVARRALPGMRALGYGRVVGLGAAAGKSGGAKSAAYAASKAGLMTLVKTIAAEFARDGVTANIVAPALIDTQLLGATREIAGRIPVGRLGTPEEVAAAVAFLVSSEAGYITGEVLDVNGGTLID